MNTGQHQFKGNNDCEQQNSEEIINQNQQKINNDFCITSAKVICVLGFSVWPTHPLTAT